MLYREIIAVCSAIHTKHINTLCGQNVEFLNVTLVVHIVTIVRYIQYTLYPTLSIISTLISSFTAEKHGSTVC